ncbi:hypothetical protein ACFE04_007895 [Oxalis oulophora]
MKLTIGEMMETISKCSWNFILIAFDDLLFSLMIEHYKYLKAKSFFPKLIEYITSGPAWEVVGVVASARKLIGATNPLQAEPGTIRGMLYMEVTTLKMGNVK